MEEMNRSVPQQPYPNGGQMPPRPMPPQPPQRTGYPYGAWGPYQGGVPVRPVAKPPFPAEKKELIFAVLSMFCGLILCNFTLFGGFNLGFALAVIASLCCAVGYLRAGGCRLNGYSAALLGLSVVITAGFARSDDGFVKFVMLCFLMLSVNLGLCLMAGQNRRPTAGITSLLDAFRTAFFLGYGQISPAVRGLFRTLRSGGPAAKKGIAVLLGLAAALPVVAILIPLLMSADAAFDGLVHLLPRFNALEITLTLIFGVGAACVLYTRSAALRHKPKAAAAGGGLKKTVSHLTVNTVLAAVCLVYLVYLFSQLAYFAGGFSGILPKEFTMAEYARRGFFEMAWLCAIDLGVMALAVGLVSKKEGKAPLSTRLLCLFIGAVTVFLVATASAKMFMYIGSYGLTRLRVLTEVIMVFLGIATALVSAWLFLPKLPYMKVMLILALVIGAAVIWVDVDTVVASYNVSAYQSGKLSSVDVTYLVRLGDSAVPFIARLVDDSDPIVAQAARAALGDDYVHWNDFRDWNYANWYAEELMSLPIFTD